MAAKLVSEIHEDFLTCALCLKPYQHPKALPCLHSFCMSCLADHLHASAVKSAKSSDKCIFCPVCRQVTEIPKNGVAGFQDNYLLKNLLDMVYGARGVLQPCDLCKDEGKRAGAGYCCIKCEDFLCDDCAAAHKRTRVTKEHLVINVSMMKELCMKSMSDMKITVRLLTKIGKYGADLLNPIALATNQADDIIVSNNNNMVSVWDQSGNVKKRIDQRVFYGEDSNHLPNRGVAVTTEGFLAVAMRRDIVGNAAQIGVVESLAARQAGIFNTKTRSPENVIPHGIATTTDNYTIITDVGKHCFYVYNPDMQEVKQVGRRGSRNSQFKCPFFVHVNKRREIMISDYDNHCIKFFSLKGKYLKQFGAMGTAPGEFMHPMGLCTDAEGNIYVCDRDNHRVQMFTPDGTFLTIICQNTCRDGNDVRPQDVAMTTDGHLVVLVRGVEGINVAEIHILQIGTRFGDHKDEGDGDNSSVCREISGHIAKLRQSLEFLKTPSRSKKGQLPPLSGKTTPLQPSAPASPPAETTLPHATPELLGPSFGGQPYEGAKGGAAKERKDTVAGLLMPGGGANGHNSAICTIL